MKNEKKLKSLGDIAAIRSGFTFRGKIEEVVKGNAYVLQIKDFRKSQKSSGSDVIIPSTMPQIHWEARGKAVVEPGTVLLPSRGGYYRSAYMDEGEAELPLIASSQFILIKPFHRYVVPAFLSWLLNRPRTQQYMEEIASQGSGISMLSTASAKAIKLQIPSLDTQHKILHLNRLWEQEQQLTQALLDNREAMLQGVFQQLLKESN